MTEHILKTLPTPWQAVKDGKKTWEVRRNDRFFQQGDVVILRKTDESGNYPMRGDGPISTCDLKFKIGWVLQGGQFGIEPGYCVFSLEKRDALLRQAMEALGPFARLGELLDRFEKEFSTRGDAKSSWGQSFKAANGARDAIAAHLKGGA